MAKRRMWFLLVDHKGAPYKGTSATSVVVSSNGVIDQFRDAVKAEYADSHLRRIAPSDLLVYADKTTFDANTAEAPTQPGDDIGGLGAKGAKMVVVVPQGAARDVTAAIAPVTVEQLTKTLDDHHRKRDPKRSVYSISTCPLSRECSFKEQLNLEYDSLEVDEVLDDSISGYPWSALPEKHPDQRKAYMAYVEENLRDALIARQKQKDFLKDVAGERDLLDCDDQHRLAFKVKGTADMVIIDDVANRMDDVFAGLRFVIDVRRINQATMNVGSCC